MKNVCGLHTVAVCCSIVWVDSVVVVNIFMSGYRQKHGALLTADHMIVILLLLLHVHSQRVK